VELSEEGKQSFLLWMFVKLNPAQAGFKEEKIKEKFKKRINLDHFLKVRVCIKRQLVYVCRDVEAMWESDLQYRTNSATDLVQRSINVCTKLHYISCFMSVRRTLHASDYV
jgi:hypothetical protein